VGVVIVAHDPGPWFTEVLESWAAQDYPNFSVLVVESHTRESLVPVVANVLPDAYVTSIPASASPGFGTAANAGCLLVSGATHYVLAHDDVAPEPDALRRMVEEAFRSNAGMVAPKAVAWDDPRILLSLGMEADRLGAVSSRVEPEEMDHGQHDAVRDVFVATGGCVLVRSDLFEALRGYDPAIVAFGEDLDLSWRARVLGARIVVAPTACVRHRQALVVGERKLEGDFPEPYALQRRNQLRTVLKVYRSRNLAPVLASLAVLETLELMLAFTVRQPRRARAIAGAWGWNLARLGQIRTDRSALQKGRRSSDREIRDSQLGWSARLERFVRHWFAYGRYERLHEWLNRDVMGAHSIPATGAGPDGSLQAKDPGGTAPAGTAPAGTAPAGTAPAGTAPAGTAPAGTAAAGTSLSGTPAASPAPLPICDHT